MKGYYISKHNAKLNYVLAALIGFGVGVLLMNAIVMAIK